MFLFLLLFWRDDQWYNHYLDRSGMYLLEFLDARMAHAWRNHYMFEGCWTILLDVNLNFALSPARRPTPRLALDDTAPVSAARPVDIREPILTVLHGLSI